MSASGRCAFCGNIVTTGTVSAGLCFAGALCCDSCAPMYGNVPIPVPSKVRNRHVLRTSIAHAAWRYAKARESGDTVSHETV